jgi:ribonuclease HII
MKMPMLQAKRQTSRISKQLASKRYSPDMKEIVATASSTATIIKPKKTAKKSERSKSKLAQLLKFDAEMKRKWVRSENAVIVGTDEVGRGCLAGPVVAAAVVLPAIDKKSDLAKALAALNDSKKLSPAVREEISAVLKANCRYAIAEGSVEEIDKINILNASLSAMRSAISELNVHAASAVLVDGNRKIADLQQQQILVIGGDGTSAAIAAASVIAKVHRDNLMARLHDDYPHYCWNSNKGYGSKSHCAAIIEHGLTTLHRKSFCSRIVNEQLSLLDLDSLENADESPELLSVK